MNKQGKRDTYYLEMYANEKEKYINNMQRNNELAEDKNRKQEKESEKTKINFRKD